MVREFERVFVEALEACAIEFFADSNLQTNVRYRGTQRGAARPSRFDAKWLVIGVCVALTLYLAVVPLGFLLWQSFFTPQTAAKAAEFTFGNYRQAYAPRETWALFWNSLQFAIGTALLAFVLGTALAWMNERTNTPFKGLFFALSLIPLIIPGILFTVAWILLGSPKIGIINLVLQSAVRHRRRVLQRLLDVGNDLGRRAALLADGLPADDRGVPRDGPGARGVGDDERRERLAGRVARSRCRSSGRRSSPRC